MTEHHLMEFAWGLANSKIPFLWIMRPDVVMGTESITLSQEFLDEVKDRGYITNWCFQDQVLAHPSVGVFLTHCGWNSTMEGIEVNHDVKREEITTLVKEMIKGEKGKEMRQKCLEWKKKGIKATDLGGSSYNNFHNFIKEALHHNAI
ncbi:UDP-glucuronosyl/UDP-glucosyltransferase [Sesbania bispinosa]|nr:UDP-glucuronosyl/UDP-glucosyltransferase [Sesbania bispinosa]